MKLTLATKNTKWSHNLKYNDKKICIWSIYILINEINIYVVHIYLELGNNK